MHRGTAKGTPAAAVDDRSTEMKWTAFSWVSWRGSLRQWSNQPLVVERKQAGRLPCSSNQLIDFNYVYKCNETEPINERGKCHFATRQRRLGCSPFSPTFLFVSVFASLSDRSHRLDDSAVSTATTLFSRFSLAIIMRAICPLQQQQLQLPRQIG